MANDYVSNALASAKATLAHSNTSFPTRASSAAPAAAKPAASAASKPAPSIGQELAVKKQMVDKAQSALPKMHEGGKVHADGAYELKAGEHVLTAQQAKVVRKHALMAVGMNSLTKPAATTDLNTTPSKVDKTSGKVDKQPAKKSTSGVTVRPSKSAKKK